MKRVSMVLDFEGFTVGKRFYVREVGSFNWRGDATHTKFKMPMRLNQLSKKDRASASYVTRKIHGLGFDTTSGENAQPQGSVADHVKALYNDSRAPELDVVAFKGGHVERDLLQRLNIPFLDLEEYGCPKMYRLMRFGGENMGCGEHRGLLHCSMMECWLF